MQTHHIPFTVTPTRYHAPASYHLGVKTGDAVSIGYGMQAPGRWRYVVDHAGPALCGPQYKTKGELLADLPRYAGEAWGLQ